MAIQAPETFICSFCDEVRDFHSQAVIGAALPEDPDCIWVAGMPCRFMGFCIVCLGDEE